MLGRIFDCCEDFDRIIFFCQCASRTDRDTLTAADTAGVSKFHIERASDVCSKTTFIRADNADALVLFANSDTASAENTFIIVTNQMDC